MKITSSVIKDRLGFSRQQLYYWRQVGIISPPPKTLVDRGHYRYEFQDFKVLKTIKYLRDSGISTFKIRKCFKNLRNRFPHIKNPFTGKPVFVFGDKVVFVYNGRGYDAISGQSYLLDFRSMKRWANQILSIHDKKAPAETEMILWFEAQG